MNWNCEYLDNDKVVFIKYKGRVTLDLLKDSFKACLALASKSGVNRYLVDHTELIPSLSAIEVYEIPKIYDQLYVKKSSKIAVIKSKNPSLRENTKFFETVSRNRGYSVKLFDDKQSCLKWLNS